MITRTIWVMLMLAAAPVSLRGQAGPLDALRQAEYWLTQGGYDSARVRLEGLLYTDLAAPAAFYLGWVQYEAAANLDSAWTFIRLALARDYSLNVDQHKYVVSPDYLLMFDRAKLEVAQQSPAFVTVTAHPWANVSIDDEELGATPLIDYRLLPGRHTIVLYRDGYRRVSEALLLPPGTRRLVGPVSLQARADTIVIPQRPLRERASDGWSMRAVLALDSGDTREALRQLGALPETDPQRAIWLVFRGVIHQLEGATDLAQQRYQEAIEAEPGIGVGADDINPAVARLFAQTRDQMRPGASFLVLSPESIVVNRESLYLRMTTRRAQQVTAELRHLGTGRVVWQVNAPGDSLLAFQWDGRVSPDLGGGAVPTGRYELAVRPVGRTGLDGVGFSKWLDIRSAPPDTSFDPGDIPDSLLVKETRSGGARVGSIVQGILFGAAAGALPAVAGIEWNVPGLTPASGAVAVGSATAALGLLGAVFLDTSKPLSDRVERNARARARWDAQRQQLREQNAVRLAQPYPLIVRVVQ
jgi:tetratricopeptide (TPR) repeat protein